MERDIFSNIFLQVSCTLPFQVGKKMGQRSFCQEYPLNQEASFSLLYGFQCFSSRFVHVLVSRQKRHNGSHLEL